MKNVLRFALFGLLLAGLCLLNLQGVSANAVPPPQRMWFAFERINSAPALPHALQLLACETETCDAPLAIYQYRVCDAAECLPGAVESSDYEGLECAGNRCVLTIYGGYSLSTKYFKLIAQYSDRVRSSAATVWTWGEWNDPALSWTVQVRETDLTLAEKVESGGRTLEIPDLLQSMALTFVTELVVAGVGLWLLRKAEIEKLSGRLLMVGLINILSYPLVWIVFPFWTQFQNQSLRTFSVYLTAAILLYVVALVWVYSPARPKVGWKIALTALSLPFTLVMLFAVMFVASYGNYRLAVPGMSYPVMVLVAEVFVVAFEATLIFVLSRKTVPLKHAVIVSLSMNLASFLAGLVVFF
ncbi:MAG: hypothetical protein JXA21_21430 [Anaerolineae bacterium]|nr:hypothetical protein [Anaerolineae bacterium]